MKRIFACLLCLLLLAGCGSGESGELSPPEAETSAKAVDGETVGIHMAMEWPVYGEGVTDLICIVTNETDDHLEFGLSYTVEHLEDDGTWRELPWKENWGINDLALVLEPQAKAVLSVYLEAIEFDFSPGSYRVVKDIDGVWASARFDIGESAVTPENPYGFGPLEDLPEDYSAGTAADADVVFTEDGPRNLEAAETFLEKAQLGVPCQLRTVQDYGEGAPMVIDVIYENDCFLWRMRQDGGVAEQRFSYIVTDGADVYLSNGADWENTVSRDSKKAFLLPEGTASRLIPAVEDMTANRLAGNAARYRVWSLDGVWDAMLTEEPTEFSVGWQMPGQGSRGGMYDLQDWNEQENAILSLAWQEDGRLRLDCETAAGGTDILYFDPETERLTDR